MDDRVTLLERRLGLPFTDRKAAVAALTHKSYVNEHRSEGLVDNERLEFLGDAVIDLAVSHRLMERYPDAKEGMLSRLRASIVNEGGLARVAESIGLGELLFLGKGEEQTGGRRRPSVLADALEAVVAALYLGGGLSLVLRFVDLHFDSMIAEAAAGMVDRDYKTQVQELAQGTLKATPRYRLLEEHGPDHAKTFLVEVTIAGERYGTGEGRSKKEAEQIAARQAYAALTQRLART